MSLQGRHLLLDKWWVEERNGSLLERDIGAAVKVRPATTERVNEFLWSHDPGNPPTWKAEALGQTVDQDPTVVLEWTFDKNEREEDAALSG